jgi:hypothetical protein
MRGYRRPITLRSSAAIPNLASAPNSVVRFLGRTAASTTAHPSERATWTGAAASSRRVARCSRGNTKVPAASDGSSGRPSASSAQSVEGAPLMTAAKEPAARPSRNASRSITFASFPQARIHVLCAPLVGALADFRVGRAASVRRPDAARCCFAWKAIATAPLLVPAARPRTLGRGGRTSLHFRFRVTALVSIMTADHRRDARAEVAANPAVGSGTRYVPRRDAGIFKRYRLAA